MDQAIIDRVVSVMGGLDEDKLAVLSSRITRQMVIACAGAGKTRLCKARILGAVFEGVAPEEILYISFSRACVKDFGDQIDECFQDAGMAGLEPVYSTVDSLIFKLLNVLGVVGGSLYPLPAYTRLLSKEASKLGLYDVPVDVLESMGAMQTGSLMSRDDLCERFKELMYGVKTKQGLDFLFERVLQVLDAVRGSLNGSLTLYDIGVVLLGAITDDETLFVDLGLERWLRPELERTLRREMARNYMRRYKLVVVDEVQDLSSVQHHILELLLGMKAPGVVSQQLCMVGDDDQCIYEWRASSPKLMQLCPVKYGLEIKMLSKSYRCPDAMMSLGKSILDSTGGFHYDKDLRGNGTDGVCRTLVKRGDSLSARFNQFGTVCGSFLRSDVGMRDGVVLSRYRSSQGLLGWGIFYNVMKEQCGDAGWSDVSLAPITPALPIALSSDTLLGDEYIDTLLRICGEVGKSLSGEYPNFSTLLRCVCPYIRTEDLEKVNYLLSSASFFDFSCALVGCENPLHVGPPLSADWYTGVKAICANLPMHVQKGLRVFGLYVSNLAQAGSPFDGGAMYRWLIRAALPAKDDGGLYGKHGVGTVMDRGRFIEGILDELGGCGGPLANYLSSGPIGACAAVAYICTCITNSFIGGRGALCCETVHGAKGRQWDYVFFIDRELDTRVFQEDPEEGRIAYVGVTRARKELYC